MHEPIDVAAWRNLIEDAPAGLRAVLGLGVERHRGATALLAQGLDTLLVNRAFDAERPADAAAVVDRYRRRGIDRFIVHVPDERVDDVRERMGALGLTPYRRRWVELVRQRGPVRDVPTDLAIVEADASHAPAFGRILARAFDMPAAAGPLWDSIIGRPGWHTFVALDGDRVAAGATVFLRGAHAYLAAAATDPDYRKRGAQGALMARRLRRVFGLGCRTVVTETGEAVPGDPNHSYNNMTRHGFEPAGVRVNFVPAGTQWAAA